MLAIAALVLGGCYTLDGAVKAVKLPTVLTIVGAFGLGKAIGQHQLARVLADALLEALAPVGNVGYLVAIFAATVMLGIVFHGTATVVLMFPVCMEVAERTSMQLHLTTAVLCIAASCQVLSPISYQTNLMAYSAGGYEFFDFPKIGSGLVVLIGIVGITTCQWTFTA
jgi:di/tricarboxylate transporter